MSGLTEENLDSYTIKYRPEIIFHLRELINDGAQTSVTFNEGRDTILTLLLEVDEEQGALILDWGSNDEVNQRFLSSERNFFVATPLGIRHQFISGKPRKITYRKRPAFAVQLPKKFVRLQRRNYFRLVLPLTQRPKCTFILADGLALDAAVLDIGIGGVGLEVALANVSCSAGEKIAEAKIQLKEFSELKAGFEVRYVNQATRGVKQSIRLGCQFNDLSPAQEQLLQKYITRVQREERARLGA
jgi:flagellar brake protein